MVRYYKAVTLTVFLGFLVIVGNKIYQQKKVQNVVQKVERQEILLEELAFLWNSLSKDVKNLRLPGLHSKKFLATDISVYGLEETEKTVEETLGIKSLSFSVKKTPEIGIAPVWKGLFAKIQYFEHVQLFVIKGDLAKNFIVDLKLDALAKDHENKFLAIKIDFSIVLENFTTPHNVKIKEWKNKKVSVHQAKNLLFHDVTTNVLNTQILVDFATGSKKEDLLVSLLKNPKENPDPLGILGLSGESVTVVDINGDNWDDLYVVSKFGKNILLKNNRGVFQQSHLFKNLSIENCSAAIFADFDNDGDQDAFIGRWKSGKSMYLVNNNGTYTERNDKINGSLPLFTISFSTADYNNDGLLDIYISTYFPQGRLWKRFNDFFSEKEVKEYVEKYNYYKFRSNKFNIAKNVLLKNTGNGNFVKVSNSPLAVNKSTFQAVWSDFNDDGKQDIYIANDFSTDHLFFGLGDEKFEDVSHMLNNTVSFSMGVSVGDYNNDEQQDLYVTNMYSKAGTRIVKELLPLGVENHFLQAASGNHLFSNDGSKLHLTVGLHSLWSWGSQFVDLDNNGYLDIYAPNGQYTAPKIFSNAQDT